MKKLLFALPLLFPFRLDAQNPYFLDFGACYAHARATLEGWSGVDFLQDTARRHLHISAQGADYQYLFYRGRLYSITMRKTFARAGEARKVYRRFQDYMAHTGGEARPQGPWQEQYPFLREGKVACIAWRRAEAHEVHVEMRYLPHLPLWEWREAEWGLASSYRRELIPAETQDCSGSPDR